MRRGGSNPCLNPSEIGLGLLGSSWRSSRGFDVDGFEAERLDGVMKTTLAGVVDVCDFVWKHHGSW